jgi:hypothetical protein
MEKKINEVDRGQVNEQNTGRIYKKCNGRDVYTFTFGRSKKFVQKFRLRIQRKRPRLGILKQSFNKILNNRIRK